MPNTIVISKDQAIAIPGMVEAVRSLDPKGNLLFVLDRCSDSSSSILGTLGVEYIENREGDGFLAGKARNLGVAHLAPDDTLFLDGDRVPIGFTPEGLSFAFESYDLCLARVSQDYRAWFRDGFTTNPKFGLWDNDVYTCGLTIRKDLLVKILGVQEGHLIHPDLVGRYGQEDMFLGDMAAYLGGTCGGFPVSMRLAGGFKPAQDQDSFKTQIEIRKELRKPLLPGLRSEPAETRSAFRNKLLKKI